MVVVLRIKTDIFRKFGIQLRQGEELTVATAQTVMRRRDLRPLMSAISSYYQHCPVESRVVRQVDLRGDDFLAGARERNVFTPAQSSLEEMREAATGHSLTPEWIDLDLTKLPADLLAKVYDSFDPPEQHAMKGLLVQHGQALTLQQRSIYRHILGAYRPHTTLDDVYCWLGVALRESEAAGRYLALPPAERSALIWDTEAEIRQLVFQAIGLAGRQQLIVDCTEEDQFKLALLLHDYELRQLWKAMDSGQRWRFFRIQDERGRLYIAKAIAGAQPEFYQRTIVPWLRGEKI